MVVDELGLLGTRQLNALLRAQRTHGFQIVALDDPRQMQSVEAGSVVALLRRALGEAAIPALETSVRQAAAEERETVLMFRNGQTEEAVLRKVGNGTLRIVPGGYEEAIADIVRLWQERCAANAGRDGYSISISAPTNHDAHQLSLAIREKRRELGELGADRRTVPASDGDLKAPRSYEMAPAEGDRVRLFKRTGALFLDTGKGGNIGQNGSVLTVAEVRHDGLVLRGRAGLVKWEALRHERNGRIMLAYGGALTIHTSQGATVSEHIFAMPTGSGPVNAFGAYTSGSHHREISWMVTSDGAERAEVAARRPLGDRRSVRESDVVANIVRNFARQPEKESALALIERAEALRRGTVHGMQAGKQGLEQRELDGKPRAALAEAFARARDTARVRQATQVVGSGVTERRHVVQRMRAFREEVRNAVRLAIGKARQIQEAREQARSRSRGLRYSPVGNIGYTGSQEE